MDNVLEKDSGFVEVESTFPGKRVCQHFYASMVAWQQGPVIVKLFFSGKVDPITITSVVEQAEKQVRNWVPCEEVLLKLEKSGHYREIVVGMRNLIQPSDFKRKFPAVGSSAGR